MLVEPPLDLGVYIVVVGVDIVVGVGVFLGDIIAQPGLDVLVTVGLAGEAGAVIVVAFRHALGHLGSGQPRRVGGDAVQVVADAVVGVLPAGEVVAECRWQKKVCVP